MLCACSSTHCLTLSLAHGDIGAQKPLHLPPLWKVNEVCILGREKAPALAPLVILFFFFLSFPQCLSPWGRVLPLKAVTAANFQRHACHLSCSWGSRWG